MYGYDVDQEGELVRQIAHVDGFTGEGTSRVGPADYDLSAARHAVARNVKGIVAWKIPQKEVRQPVVIPGPADYARLESSVKDPLVMSSSFLSDVKRAGSAGVFTEVPRSERFTNNFHKLEEKVTKIKMMDKSAMGFENLNSERVTTVFADSDAAVTPGPADYEPRRPSAHKTGKIVQGFGSTMPRFTKVKSLKNLGPGTYLEESTSL